MATNKLIYRGFTGSCEVSLEDECLFGRLLFIDDIVTYEGQTTGEVTSSFKAAVDRYLEHCKNTGKTANKPYSGSFNVRVGPELHRKAVVEASACGLTLNELVVEALEARTKGEKAAQVEHNHRHIITIDIDSEQQIWAAQATTQFLETFRASTSQ